MSAILCLVINLASMHEKSKFRVYLYNFGLGFFNVCVNLKLLIDCILIQKLFEK